MSVFYVAGKYQGSTPEETTANTMYAREISKCLFLRGITPICPHMNFYGWEHETDFTWAEYLNADKKLIEKSDGIFMLPNWTNSRGARLEYRWSIEMGKDVFFSLGEVDKWQADKSDISEE